MSTNLNKQQFIDFATKKIDSNIKLSDESKDILKKSIGNIFDRANTIQEKGETEEVLNALEFKEAEFYLDEKINSELEKFGEKINEKFDSFRERVKGKFDSFREEVKGKFEKKDKVADEMNKDSTSKVDNEDVTVENSDNKENSEVKGTEDKVSEKHVEKSKVITKEEKQKNIDNLKPGETYSYTDIKSISLDTFSSITKVPVTWKREENGELSCKRREFINAKRHRSNITTVVLETRYDSTGKKKIFEEKQTSLSRKFGTYSRIEYNNGKPMNVITDITNVNDQFGSTIGIEMLLLQRLTYSKNKYDKDENSLKEYFREQKVVDKNNQVLIKSEDGKLFNAKGKEIDEEEACAILEKAYTKGNISKLIQEY